MNRKSAFVLPLAAFLPRFGSGRDRTRIRITAASRNHRNRRAVSGWRGFDMRGRVHRRVAGSKGWMYAHGTAVRVPGQFVNMHRSLP